MKCRSVHGTVDMGKLEKPVGRGLSEERVLWRFGGEEFVLIDHPGWARPFIGPRSWAHADLGPDSDTSGFIVLREYISGIWVGCFPEKPASELAAVGYVGQDAYKGVDSGWRHLALRAHDRVLAQQRLPYLEWFKSKHLSASVEDVVRLYGCMLCMHGT